MSTDPMSTNCLLLLRRFADRNDQHAFAEIVQRQAGWMRGTALRMTGDDTAADEILQDAFALLAKNLPRCESDAALLAWLHRTVVFTARNHLAKERRRARKLTTYQMEQHTGESRDQEAALRDLDTVISQLPEQDRQFIIARYMKSLAWEEMGRTFGCSAEAVRKRVSRILDRLGSMLRRRGIALPAGALLGVVASQSCAAMSASQSIAVAAAAVAKSVKLSIVTLATHAVVTMKTSQAVFSVVGACALLVAIPLALDSSAQKSASTSRQNVVAETKQASQSNRNAPFEVSAKVENTDPVSTAEPNRNTSAPTIPNTPPLRVAQQMLGKELAGIVAAAAGPADAVNSPLAAAVRATMSDPDSGWRVNSLRFLLQWMRPVDIPAIREALDSARIPGVLYVEETNAFRELWATVAGQDAMLDYTKGRTDFGYSKLHSAIVKGWASTDPDGLQDWLESLPADCDWATRARPDILDGVLRTNTARATATVLQNDAAIITAGLPRIAERVLQEGGLDALERWVRAIPVREDTTAGRAQAEFMLVERRAFVNAGDAIASLRSFENEPWGGTSMAKQLGVRYGHASHGKALAMLDQLPPGDPLASSLSEGLFPSFAKYQTAAAAAWVKANPASPYADHAAQALALAAKKSDLATARAWAASIRDETRRAALLNELSKP